MQGNRDNNIYQFNNYQNNQMNDYSADVDMYEVSQDQMDADIKMLYQQSVSMDVPDLWNRIEAGFDQEMVGVKKVQKKKTYRMVGTIAAVVLAVLIAVPVLNLSNRSKKSEDYVSDKYEMTKDDITEAAKEDVAAETYDDADMAESADMVEDAEVAESDEIAADVNEVAGADMEDEANLTIAQIIESCDGSDAPEGAKLSDISAITCYEFDMGEKGDDKPAELLRSLAYSDNPSDEKTKDISLIQKQLKKYNPLQWTGSTLLEITEGYHTNTLYVYTMTINTEGGSVTIYRIYNDDDSCPAGTAAEFARELFIACEENYE